ncbi:TPA: hypothetical protein ACKQDF_000808 [Stenotrophomonas maltophilia]
MAGPCFWSEKQNVVEDCGDAGAQLLVYFDNAFIFGQPIHPEPPPGFEVGQDFAIKLSNDVVDRTIPMIFEPENDRYRAVYKYPLWPYTDEEGVPGVITQGPNRWDVTVVVYPWS